ncbi:DUF4129 domain-containing protein [Siphonobacter sp. SORGH_AS_0500]|uniref:DUF4129 domain-containing protein n=1 Tax=Siphonobacter sp. SORGH_AS_0500 TaxID=1864824 RepID=UPI002864592C|nr:DUF4129 domain-containing protein [Siphonobacter sp. SORGH_AS_0500]MDR6193420.1 hypothetical protein [Siphonobacter sp. SORGH_AS_0500]
MRRLILFFIIVTQSVWAQSGSDSLGVGKKVLPVEAARPALRQPNAELWKDITTSRDYKYSYDPEPPTGFLDEIWQRFLSWLFDFLYSSTTRTGREWIQIAFIAAIVVFVIYKLIGMDKMGLFKRKSDGVALPYDTLYEDIHAINFQEAIEEASSQRNFRLAVRLLYLRALKTLTDQELIGWQINKTNRTYVYEITEPSVRSRFEQLTSSFEYVWYGDFPINEERYQEIKREFDSFKPVTQ